MPDLNWSTSPSGAEFLHRLACKGPADCDTIAREFATHRNNVRKIMHQARAGGVVHVERYERVSTLDRQPAKIWALGPGLDAPRVVYGRGPRHMGRWETADSAARILARLSCGDCTIKVLVAECHLADTVARGQLRQMVAAEIVHLCGYESTDGVGACRPRFTVWARASPRAVKPKAKVRTTGPGASERSSVLAMKQPWRC